MAEAALQIVTDFVRIVVEDFDLRWSPEVEASLIGAGVDLTDLRNALSNCEAKGSNKSEAVGVYIDVTGATTENLVLDIQIWIDPDSRVVDVVEVALAGAGK
jgi:hypothetical protein